jgi:hypothetical protein
MSGTVRLYIVDFFSLHLSRSYSPLFCLFVYMHVEYGDVERSIEYIGLNSFF